jgi:uncharacterized protein YdbL (DUF1318 family)
MKLIRMILAFLAAPLLAMSLVTAHAAEPAIEAAKTQGVVGEMYNGYLGYPDPSKATPDLRRRVDENNAQRLALYQRLAQQQNQRLEDVAALAAERQIGNAPSGQMVLLGAGQSWSRK